ncbi:MAG: DUF5979 domain-containing protein, partial [Butyricicoccaceae bacterium]
VIPKSPITSLADYEPVDTDAKTLNIGTGTNELIFYYKERTVTIDYKMVGPDGTVSSNLEEAYGQITSLSETLQVLSGIAQGSAATAKTNFRFVGWYTDAACDENDLISSDSLYVPDKVDGKNVAATYYAKFEYDVADLTITKTVTGGTPDQSFVFHVTGNGVDMYVAIPYTAFKGGTTASVTIKGLKVGSEYTVTEDTDWSWRYEIATGSEGVQKITIQAAPAVNKVEFNDARVNIYWLDGEHTADNIFNAITPALPPESGDGKEEENQ